MIFVAAGTEDARFFVEKLIKKKFKLYVSTFSQYGATLYNMEKTNIRFGKMDLEDMYDFIKEIGAKCILDLSHPYAEIVSINLIEASKRLNIPYLRYERPSYVWKDAIWMSSYKEASDYLVNSNKKALLTIGSKELESFQNVPKENLIIRVLPTESVLGKVEKLGYLPKQIIAMQGPFSKKFNKLVLEEKNIDILVTKESGKVGGFKEKVEACIETNTILLCIKRPTIDYPFIVDNEADLIKFLESRVKKYV